MPINRPEPPEGLENAVLAVAAELLPGRPESLGAGFGGSGAFEEALASSTRLGATRPLYHLGLDRIVDRTGLAAAQPIGWRAMVSVQGREAAFADVDERPEGPEVRQMTYGPVVSGLLEAGRGLLEEGGAPEVEYDERVVQAPGIYLTAIWLHSDSYPAADVLIPTSPVPIGVEAGRRYSEEELLAAVRDLAETRMRDDGRAPGAGGGSPPPA
jgi:hypothetical protein